jgi:hypothetical protein
MITSNLLGKKSNFTRYVEVKAENLTLQVWCSIDMISTVIVLNPSISTVIVLNPSISTVIVLNPSISTVIVLNPSISTVI